MDDGSSGFKVILKWFQSGFKMVSNTCLVRNYKGIKLKGF